MTTWTTRLGAALSAGALLLTTACSGPSRRAGTVDVIDYWPWDSAQQPGYQQCADDFAAANPGLSVQITQMGWDDYWTKLTAGFIADQAPDVFTNHVSKYAQYVDLGVLLPLDDFDATQGITSDEFQEGLGDLWIGQDGKRYGAPKDWDTVAFFYDESVTDAAGITADQLHTMTWNPADGGTFEKIIAHLTVDESGVRGDEPGFDPSRVAVYGLATDGAGGENFGETQWGPYTGSIGGWAPTDRNPWGSEFRLNDPRFQETIDWYFGLADKGYMPGFATFGRGTGSYNQMAAGKAVLSLQGSWMISSYQSLENVALQLAPTPIGPSGKRSSPFNGLADSITRFTDNPEGSAKWVAYLASDACQDVIGEAGVVFPARPSGTAKSLQARKEQGLDVTPFTDHLEDGTTQLLPVTQNSEDVKALTAPAFDAVYIGSEPVAHLTDVNREINTLYDIAAK